MIDTGVGNNLLASKQKITRPLYKQCSDINAALARLHGFAPYIAVSRTMAAQRAAEQDAPPTPTPTSPSESFSTPLPTSSRRSVDPVMALWDVLSLGAPLCFIFNLLDIPSDARLDVNCDPDDINYRDVKQAKRLVAQFVMGVHKLRQTNPEFAEVTMFTVGDLVNDTRNTNGFVKV